MVRSMKSDGALSPTLVPAFAISLATIDLD
jgi:hypothetical protein